MIVVLDSNVWISSAINQDLSFLTSLQKKKITIVSCGELIDELKNVLSRSKFKKYFTGDYADKFLQFHNLISATFQINEIEIVVSDEKDNYLFALCKVSKANYLITGDRLLLAVKSYQKTSVISLTEFKGIIA